MFLILKTKEMFEDSLQIENDFHVLVTSLKMLQSDWLM